MLAKVLFYDIVHQSHLLVGISAVDVDNCYNRIAHPIFFRLFQSLGVPKAAVVLLLSTIQDMKFFHRMGLGDSKVYVGSTDGKKTQGLCQGNWAAPAGWTVTSFTMIQAHKRKGHGVHLLCPITKTPLHLAGTLFVGDTDLKLFNMNKSETIEEAHAALQDSIHSWGRILIATGGAPKPAKCFYHLISFSWKADGSWKYNNNEKCPDLSVMVPLEDGTSAIIEHLPVTTPTNTFGQMKCPTGSSDGAIVQMRENVQAGLTRQSQASSINAFSPVFWTNSFDQELPSDSVASALCLMNLRTVLCKYTMRCYPCAGFADLSAGS
jgi:hypothetical protein